MIIDKEYSVKINYRNIDYYRNIGYCDSKMSDIIKVQMDKIRKNSFVMVDVKCDFCENSIFQCEYVKAIKQEKHFCCKTEECKKAKKEYTDLKRKKTNLERYGAENVFASEYGKQKIKETNLKKYGFEQASKSQIVKDKLKKTCMERFNGTSPMASQEVRDKIAKTNLERYGAENVYASEYGKKKIKETNLKNYGCEYAQQSQEVKDKIAKTNLERYGTENIFASDYGKQKIKETNLKKYGCEHPMQCKEFKKKTHETFLKQSHNTGVPTSQQQEFVWLEIGGELNYIISKKRLDIAFPNEKIYVEYDGGGHKEYFLKLKKRTIEEYLQYELEREKFFANLGWKEIRIIDTKSRTRTFKNILGNVKENVDYAKNILKTTNCKKVVINYDDKKIYYDDKEESILC